MVPPASRRRTTSISSSRAASYDGVSLCSLSHRCSSVGMRSVVGGRGVDAAVGDPHADLLRGGDAVDRGDDVAVGVLEDGVAALQRGQRRQGPGPGPLVADVVGGPVEGVAEGAAGAVAELVDLVEPGVEQGAGVGQRRA